MKRWKKISLIVVLFTFLMGYNKEFSFEYDHTDYEYLQRSTIQFEQSPRNQVSTADRLMEDLKSKMNYDGVQTSTRTESDQFQNVQEVRLLSPTYTKLSNKQAIFESLRIKYENNSSIQGALLKARSINSKVTETIQLLHEWQMTARDEQDQTKFNKIEDLLEQFDRLLLDRNHIETKLVSGNLAANEIGKLLGVYEEQIQKEYRLLTNFINKLLIEKYGE